MTDLVLVTGASGQVGSAVARLLSTQLPQSVVATPSRTDLDLSKPGSVRACVQQLKPRWIVSCAAYTAVDAAETDSQAAYAANAEAPGVLAEEAAKLGGGLIHFSTDYVFNGSGQRPWTEQDEAAPLNVYGASKLAGEQAIAAVAAATLLPHVVLRTSWVYSGGGKNFVRTMLRLLSTRTAPISIVADQYGAPSAASDLAAAVLAIVQFAEARAAGGALSASLQDCSGVYHCAGTGETTWAGLAQAVRQYVQLQHGLHPPDLLPVTTADYPTPALRPLNSRLNCDLLATTFGVRLPPWELSVNAALQDLAAIDLPMLQKS